MNRTFTLILFLFFTTPFVSQDFIYKVEPPSWWVGMNSSTFQLLVHGEDISNYDVNIKDERVRLNKVNKVYNNNYLFLDLEIIENGYAFDFDIFFSSEGKVFKKYTYSLLKKSKRSKDNYFNSSDVIYLISTDRFSNGNKENDIVESMYDKKLNRRKPESRHGGDIKGIINHLDYFSEMGFTTLSINNMLESNVEKPSFEGKFITDLYNIDPRFGTNKSYKKLSTKAKEKGIKLIKEVVLNHISDKHWWISDLPTEDWINNESIYISSSNARETLFDKYAFKNDIDAFTDGWVNQKSPDLNHSNKYLSIYLIQNSLWWIESANLNGLFINSYSSISRDFLFKWNKSIQEEYPGFSIHGDDIDNDKSSIGLFQNYSITKGKDKKQTHRLNTKIKHKISSVSDYSSLNDYPLQKAILNSFKSNDLNQIYLNLSQDYLYPNPNNMVVFLDAQNNSSHFLELINDFQLWKIAHAFLMVSRGIPHINYGTEVLLSPNSVQIRDGNIRLDFPGGWDRDKKDAFKGLNLTDQQIEAKSFMKKLLQWRKTCSTVHYGRLKHFSPSLHNDIYIILRYDKRKVVLMAMNVSNESKKFKPDYFINQLNLKLNNMEAVNVIDDHQLDISKNVTIGSKSFLLIELYY